jgi:hypothetical protein
MTVEDAWALWARPKTLRAVGLCVTAIGLASALPSGISRGVEPLESATRCAECICSCSTHAPAVIIAALVVFSIGSGMTWLAARALLRERAGQAERRFDVVPRALRDHALFLGAVAVFVALAGSPVLASLLGFLAAALRTASTVARLRRQRFIDAVLDDRAPRWSFDFDGRRGVLLLEVTSSEVHRPYRSTTSRHPVAVL